MTEAKKKESTEHISLLEKNCPIAAQLSGRNCPFLERFFEMEKDIKVLSNDVKWLKQLLVPIFVGTMSIVIKIVIEVLIGG